MNCSHSGLMVLRVAADLPSADAIIITWASAEWASLEHVFCTSNAPMPYESCRWVRRASAPELEVTERIGQGGIAMWEKERV